MKRFLMPLLAVLLSSCSVADYGPEDGMIHVYMEGKVLDDAGTAIKHIKVSVLAPGMHEPYVVYTSAQGIFRAECRISYDDLPATIGIGLEDIDGTGNGGTYCPLSDKVTVFRENIKGTLVRIPLDYRLTPSIASENSLRAL